MVFKRVVVLIMTVALCVSTARGEISWSGHVSPDDPTTWTPEHGVSIGSYSDGTLEITNGATVSNGSAGIGSDYFRSTGVVTVSGPGSTWTSFGNLSISGHLAKGTLNITDGALVEVTGDTRVAGPAVTGGAINLDNGTLTTGGFWGAPSGTGTINARGLIADVDLVFDAIHGLTQGLTLDGPGQNITVNLDVSGSYPMGAGHHGEGSLHISDGVTIQSTYGCLGSESGSTGIATVSGPESAWTNSEDITVGYRGDASLDITDGAAVSNENCYIGRSVGSSGAVTVSGSTWTSSARFHVGYGGDATLNITNGGAVVGSGVSYDPYSYLAYSSTSTGSVTVSGAGSRWSNPDELYVGKQGRGALEIIEGGTVSNMACYIAHESGSEGSVTVSGAGSTWTTSGDLYVGKQGHGALEIIEGGTVNNKTCYIGHESDSEGLVTVSGAGSTWTTSGDLYVGYSGGGALNIADGGLVEVSGDTCVERNSQSPGGALSLDNGTLTTRGFWGAVSGTGTINATGLFTDILGLRFDAASGLTQTLVINGPGQNITVNLAVDGSHTIGAGYGGAGSMHIEDGLVVPSTRGYVGYKSGSTGAVTVSGAGSTWAMSENLYVGYAGYGELEIAKGAVVSNVNGSIGSISGSEGSVTVDGLGSTWTNSGDLHIGYDSDGMLEITNGGAVSNIAGYIGRASGSMRSVVTVSDAGSIWTNSDTLDVGYVGKGSLKILNGGTVSNTDGRVGYSSDSTGAVTVSGAESTWTNSGDLCVGYWGQANLIIDNGGLVSVGGSLTIDHDSDGDAFLSMSSGGMLALAGDADDSLGDFLWLINGTGLIRYWDQAAWDWADITGATPGDDYTLTYLTTGDLAGYTMLTVIPPVPVSGDTNRDFLVDHLDYANLIAQFGGAPGAESADFNGDGFVDLEDFCILRKYYGSGVVAAPGADLSATTPEPATLIMLLGGIPFLGRRSHRPRRMLLTFRIRR